MEEERNFAEFDEEERVILKRCGGRNFDHKKEFLKRYLDTLSRNEIKFVGNILKKCKRNSKSVATEDEQGDCDECSYCAGKHSLLECLTEEQKIIKDKDVSHRAQLTLPDNLMSSSGGHGIVAKEFIEEGTSFGPMQAPKRWKRDPSWSYILKVYESNGKSYYLNVSDTSTSNWMVLVRYSDRSDEINIWCYESRGKIFFHSSRDIESGEELVVGYAPGYAAKLRRLLPHAEVNMIPSETTTKSYLGPVALVRPSVVSTKAPAKPKPWFTNFKDSQFVAIDCEFVPVPKNPVDLIKRKNKTLGKKKIACRQMLATVGICDFWGHEVFKAKVFHKKGSYLVNYFTKRVNGFTESSLSTADAQPIATVIEKVKECLQGKVVVGHGLEADLKACDIGSGDYETFDLQWWWYREEMNRDHVLVRKEFKLKALVKHFLQEDFQDGVHEAFQDALATMRVFREGYIPLGIKNPLIQKENAEGTDYIDAL